MPALTANTGRVSKKTRVEAEVELTITDNVRLFAGSIGMCTSAGRCSPAAAAASNRGCWGVAKLNPNANPDGTYDGSWNNTLTGHAADFYKVILVEGVYKIPTSGTDVVGNNGVIFYSASDNDTHLTNAGTEPITGLHEEFLTATLSYIEMSAKIGIGI